ncbi:phosphate ABC transporter permease PstA [Thioalkalivibrio sp. HK1]|uniref:phosphate ABC transporter permease PstA n=1 Tax=Thioalkalivibrio sp. HK1 TaxID=1469245 RepID=UPI0004714723|nr:phosphate ABC transporter permease PstA [Thioalkalivibrio sp. HK1]
MNASSNPKPSPDGPRRVDVHTSQAMKLRLARRHAADRRFRAFGIAAIAIALIALLSLFISITSRGYTAFVQTRIALDITYDAEILGIGEEANAQDLAVADYRALIRKSMQALFPDVRERRERRDLLRIVSSGAEFELRAQLLEDPSLIGQTRRVWLTADDDVDMLIKGYIDRNAPETERRLGDRQIAWIEYLEEAERIDTFFNTTFFIAGDSREPELAGIRSAATGSLLTLLVTLLLSFPIGVATAVYLEEFAPTNKLTDLIEVNINNLAAVPSIIFGLLGLAVFINFFSLPRSAPLVGGLVLTLMTLPTIIIAGRAALKSVPPSIREAALGMGASKMQTVTHHVLPLALPGMLTGAVIGMAQALGESAPLLMIGMVAFIVDVPGGFFDPSTALPVQIFLWADSPERAFLERTSAAIMVLLAFLIAMNALAIVLRQRFEKRW